MSQEKLADVLAGMAVALETIVDYLLNGEIEKNETINQALLILQQLSPELQKVALEQMKNGWRSRCFEFKNSTREA
ncbi:hypothetical protein SAMN02910384_02805 [Pseudobutyrivibrio sp. ACV-2]|uniref:hypothetical protein n=1 Tax=Pseudobutyrivibrio sp. ACV-2 TaxID=1520801 RepID=UPI00089BBE49|nr:hypothetical protein [Pseudobutyrivibrio sp. ACV-2]SEA94643.1 hypothetical protein SAMN02910384_02805 [Pseudobutyrivibrio sp. ACV-2]